MPYDYYIGQRHQETALLTETQLTTVPTEDLERLKVRIVAELTEREQRRRPEEERRRRDESGAAEDQETGPGGTYQWEMVECGHKDRCKKCKGGQKHGPYLYRYVQKNGRYTSEYVKLAEARELGFERPSAFT